MRWFTLVLLMVFHMAFAEHQYFKLVNADQHQTLQQQIQQAQSAVSTTKHQYQQAQQQLADLEQKIGQRQRVLRQLNQQSQSNQVQIAQLQKQQQDIMQALQQGHALLKKQIAAMYMASHVSPWQVLLSENNVNNIARYLNYNHFSLKARQASLQQLQQQAKKLQTNQQKIEQLQVSLKQNLTKKNQQQAGLAKQQQQRQQLLSQLQRQLGKQQNRLADLLANQKALQHVLHKVQVANQGITIITDEQQANAALQQTAKAGIAAHFYQMKHRLTWPVAGNVSKTFNSDMNGGRLHFNGILISAAAGTPVRAIYPGKVLFANWLRGLGLLIIIDHGDGYLSLYGRNQSLYATVGDTVQAGDMIATVGTSGGYKQPSLYFALRHHQQFLNPQAWLK